MDPDVLRLHCKCKMKSISGVQPVYSKTTAQEKTAIDAFGTRAKFFGGAIVNTLTDLLIMFGKSTNTQAVYGNGNMSGYDAGLEPTMGVKQNAVIGGGQFYGTSDGKSLNKILHSIVLGSWQQWMRDPVHSVSKRTLQSQQGLFLRPNWSHLRGYGNHSPQDYDRGRRTDPEDGAVRSARL